MRTWISAGLAVILWSLSAAAVAQTNEEINAGLQFSFSPPGARSLAMAGAFSGLADDATAAFANPAGLIWLTRSEFSLEGRHRTYTTRYPFSGSASGQPTSNGIDTRDDLEFRDFDSDVAGLSFLSYAHVFGPRRPKLSRLRLAFYRHELATYEARLQSEGPFIRNGGDGPLIEQTRNRSRISALLGALDLTIVNHGASAAYSLTDNIWLGLGVAYSTFDYNAVTRRFGTSRPARDASGNLLTDGRTDVSFAPADFSDTNESERSIQEGEDGDLAATIGLIWKPKGSVRQGDRIHWSLGLVYRQGPTFDFDYRFQWEDQRIALTDETGNQDFVDPGVVRALTGTTQFEVPDVLSLGFMFRPKFVPGNALTLSFEIDRVNYSSLEPEANLIVTALRGFRRGIEVGLATCGDFNRIGERYDSEVRCVPRFLPNFEIEDATELHFGLEYVIERRLRMALRLGAWFDPDHQLAYDFGDRNIEDLRPQDRFGLRFAKGDDEMHWTGGFGIALSRVQLDLAFDLSDRANIFSLSSVFRL